MLRRRARASIAQHSAPTTDMTPMIDIVFLLLIFFLLTTAFIPDELAIESLLPTQEGNSKLTEAVIEPPEDINIIIVPAGMERNRQPSWYQHRWLEERQRSRALLSVGNTEPVEVAGAAMDPHQGSDPAVQDAAVRSMHAYIHGALALRELPAADRAGQDPVVINCFSGLPWRYAIVAYDAVRAYERECSDADPGSLREADARVVNFSPPRIRHYSPLELGNELYEIIHKR